MDSAMTPTTQQERISFSTVRNRVPYPDLLEVQLKSFRDFFQMDTTVENRKNEGLYRVFQENFPITDTRNNFVLEFLDYYIDPPRYSIEECLERGLTYSVPLKAKLKLYCTDDEHVAPFPRFWYGDRQSQSAPKWEPTARRDFGSRKLRA